MNKQDAMVRQLIGHKVPMIKKVEYENNRPVREFWLPCIVEKRGIFWYANAKRLPRNWIAAMAAVGLVELKGA
jgi:hypothetical protein